MRILKDYRGRDVRLTDERLRHIMEHPEMSALEAAIEETLAHPQSVFQSASDENANLSYSYLRDTFFGDKWLCVVVRYDKRDAFVLTAYLTDRPKKGEHLWPVK